MKRIAKTAASVLAAFVVAGSIGAAAFTPGSITVGGQDIPIAADGYVGYSMNNGEAWAAQAIIDTGAVASAVNQLNTQDGGNTHIMAHNPGTFSPIANTIHNGAKYVVTDFNGNSKVYEFYWVAEIGGHVPFDESHPIWTAIWGNNGETVTIQYCAYGSGTPQIWIGYVSDDQSLLEAADAPSLTAVGPVEQEENENTLPETESSSSTSEGEGSTEEKASSKEPKPELEEVISGGINVVGGLRLRLSPNN